MGTLELHRNDQLLTVARKLVAWFDRESRDWDSEYRETDEFFDLQDIVDRAREVSR